MINTKTHARIYREELLNNVIPFWQKHSRDALYGGFLTCLGRDGKVYDTDKFMWLQGRQVWMFSTLYRSVTQDDEWFKLAQQGASFMLKNGRDENGDWYFSLNRQGRPLTMPHNIFSDCFAAMGLGALYKIHPIDEYADVARHTFQRIQSRRDNPKAGFAKNYPGTRDLKGFALPMILSNLSLELEHLLDAQLVDTLLDEVVHEVMDVFYDGKSGLILENVTAKGEFSDSFEGRLVNPGHVLEAMWFMMDLAVRRGDQQLIQRCVDIALYTLEYGWDKEYGGVLYFMDVYGHPTQQLEWNQKLWWVHLEAMVCMAKAWHLTGNETCRDWFYKLHEYTFSRFPDPAYGEWFGYLDRQGKPLLTLKGGKWKGCFHVPRGLFQLWKTMDSIAAKQQDLIVQDK